MPFSKKLSLLLNLLVVINASKFWTPPWQVINVCARLLLESFKLGNIKQPSYNPKAIKLLESPGADREFIKYVGINV